MPFRLTSNLIDVFGVSGIEGTFRCTCELAIRCMRENHDLLISVLESLLYDPLMDWKTFNPDPHSVSGSSVFSNILKVVENRLRGVYGERMINKREERRGVQEEKNACAVRHRELSVQGQVENVIKDATDLVNLAQMYIGWMPFI